MKIYQTKTQADYDALMVKLEGEGCVWRAGENPTEFDNWEALGEMTCVEVKDNRLRTDTYNRYAKNHPDIPIIPFAATDNVNHPSHYKQGNQETIDIIEDLKKARWYLDRAIENLDKE